MSITSLLNIIILFTAFGDCLKRWPIRSISDLDREIEVVKWIKKYTVPNTLNPQGAAWTVSQLPKISAEGDYGIFGFYREKNADVCPVFQSPAQIPPKGAFPLQIFTYSNCQGTAQNIDSARRTFKDTGGDCSCCARNEAGGRLIGPNQICRPRDGKSDWQNGIFAMEMSHVAIGAKGVADRTNVIYRKLRGNTYSYIDVLDNTLANAGFPSGTQVYTTVMGCFPVINGKRQYVDAGQLTMGCANLVKSWLTRNHLVGLTLALFDNTGWLGFKAKNGEYNFASVIVLANYFNS